MGWENHRNAKKTSRAERLSEAAAGILFPSERHSRTRQETNEYAGHVGGMRSAPGGSTTPGSKPLSWAEKRKADKILRAGKQKWR